jgi:hypothetical protein
VHVLCYFDGRQPLDDPFGRFRRISSANSRRDGARDAEQLMDVTLEADVRGMQVDGGEYRVDEDYGDEDAAEEVSFDEMEAIAFHPYTLTPQTFEPEPTLEAPAALSATITKKAGMTGVGELNARCVTLCSWRKSFPHMHSAVDLVTSRYRSTLRHL